MRGLSPPPPPHDNTVETTITLCVRHDQPGLSVLSQCVRADPDWKVMNFDLFHPGVTAASPLFLLLF